MDAPRPSGGSVQAITSAPLSRDEAEQLARKNLWRCSDVARRMTTARPWQRDEAESVALVGLAAAVATWDPARGPFARHAAANISSRVASYLGISSCPKGYRLRDYSGWTKAPVVTPAGSSDAVDGAAPVGHPLEWAETIAYVCRHLPPRHARVFRARIEHDADLGATARRLGMSRARAYRLYRQAVAMIREDPRARRLIHV